MIKSNRWHDDGIDIKTCWRFFKYKLVLDDIRNKLRRDKALLQKVKDRKQSLDNIQSSPRLPLLAHPTDTNQTQGSSSGTAHQKICTCCRCPQLKDNEDPQQDDSDTTPPEWKIPCAIEKVLKRVDHLLPEIDALSTPLGEINGMIRSPLRCLLTIKLITLRRFMRLNFPLVQVTTANTLHYWQLYSSPWACSRFEIIFVKLLNFYLGHLRNEHCATWSNRRTTLVDRCCRWSSRYSYNGCSSLWLSKILDAREEKEVSKQIPDCSVFQKEWKRSLISS